MNTETNFVATVVGFMTKVDHQTTLKLLDLRSCLMIDLGRETDGNNEICLGVRFALCAIEALRLARIEHCSGTVVTLLVHSLYNFNCTKKIMLKKASTAKAISLSQKTYWRHHRKPSVDFNSIFMKLIEHIFLPPLSMSRLQMTFQRQRQGDSRFAHHDHALA